MRLTWLIGFGAAAGCGAIAHAETLPVEGIYAAGTDAPSQVRSIAVADFSGRAGERLAFAIDSALRGAVIEGRPYFDLTFTAPAFGNSYTYDGGNDARGQADRRGGPDAVMRGIAEVEWRDSDAGAKDVEECAIRDDRGKCTEKKTVSYPCRAREVSLRPEVRLVAHGGELLYAKGDTLTASRRFCKDERDTPSVDSMIEELAGGFAAAMRSDLAPQYRSEGIRLLESRDAIAKADHTAFKAAVRQTKTDIAGACSAFEALEPANPRAVSVVFNIGLCHESAGDLEAAGQFYQAVLDVKLGKVEAQEGLGRIASRLRAEQQISIHTGRDAR